MTFAESSGDLQPPRRRHAGDDAAGPAGGPKPGRDSFTPKLGRWLLKEGFQTVHAARKSLEHA